MTTAAIGAVSKRNPQVQGYSVSASVVNPTVTITEAVPPPSPAPTPPVYVTVNGVSTSLDNAGMTAYPLRAQFIQSQGEAVKSAAQNTALAFGLNTTTAADNAIRFANAAFRSTIRGFPDPTINTTVVIIPP